LIFFFVCGKPYFKVLNILAKNYKKIQPLEHYIQKKFHKHNYRNFKVVFRFFFVNIAAISLMIIINEDEKNTKRRLELY